MDDMSPIAADPDGRARVPNSDRLFRLLRVTREEREPWIHPLMAEFNAQRRARKVTVKELARRSGYSIHTINHYSRGCGRPSAQMLADLGDAIGIRLCFVPVEAAQEAPESPRPATTPPGHREKPRQEFYAKQGNAR